MLECSACHQMLPDNYEARSQVELKPCSSPDGHTFKIKQNDVLISRKAPCPWCNDGAVKLSAGDGWWYVECDSCGARGPRATRPREAAEAWNKLFISETMHALEMAANVKPDTLSRFLQDNEGSRLASGARWLYWGMEGIWGVNAQRYGKRKALTLYRGDDLNEAIKVLGKEFGDG